MDTILVIGNWSSGTTAVTGFLARMRGFTCPPTIETNDPRTPDSYESAEFRHACAEVCDEFTLQRIGDPHAFAAWFRPWLSGQQQRARLNGKNFILLKHPLSAFVLTEIDAICQPKIIVVTRRYDEIEQTRIRRGWAPNYGAAGAQIIYSTAFTTLIEQQLSFVAVDFKSFRSNRENRDALIRYCGLTPTEKEVRSAEAWIN